MTKGQPWCNIWINSRVPSSRPTLGTVVTILRHFVYRTFDWVFWRRNLTVVGPFYAVWGWRSHTGGKCVTCYGLTRPWLGEDTGATKSINPRKATWWWSTIMWNHQWCHNDTAMPSNKVITTKYKHVFFVRYWGNMSGWHNVVQTLEREERNSHLWTWHVVWTRNAMGGTINEPALIIWV